MGGANEPSTGRRLGVGVTLLVIDLVLTARSVYGGGTVRRLRERRRRTVECAAGGVAGTVASGEGAAQW